MPGIWYDAPKRVGAMYENVRRTKGPGLYRLRGNLFLTGGILACVAVAVLVIGLVVYAGWYQLRFRSFLRDLSDSTTFAYENDCLYAEMDDREALISGDNVYIIYRLITNAGPGRLGAVPDEEPDVVLEYGDGSFLQLWSVTLVNSSTDREYGLFLRYVNQQGKSYAYDTDRIFLEHMTARLPAAEPALEK